MVDREKVIKGLECCLLDGWEKSNGACLEKAYAVTVGMKVLSLKDLGVVINA